MMTPPPADALSYPAGLTWGIKRSFIRYIACLSDGSHTVSDGAYLSDTSFFTFPWRTPDVQPPPAKSACEFRGTVRLGGHAGLLAVVIAEPAVEVLGERTLLTVLDPSGLASRGGRLPVADLTLVERDAGGTRLRYECTLSPEGIVLFGDQYEVGQQLDDVIVQDSAALVHSHRIDGIILA